ncbi:MAG TPA: signal peptidase I [Candidatus Binatia bacterium]|nr:signal peptidase I [Candidatus Binatia bacterium]
MEPSPSLTVDSTVAVPARLAAKSTLREYFEALGVALLVALFVRTFAVQAFKIPSGSMLPTLQIGDHILVNKLAYGLRVPVPHWSNWDSDGKVLVRFGLPQPGDVIVFVYPADRSKDFIKRVVGLPGDVVEIRHKRVFVNGVPRDDPHAYFADGFNEVTGGTPRDELAAFAVPPGHLFVMGDNRDRSYDSRFWGFVPLEDIKGKAFVIYWSWDGQDRWVRWERLGDRVN